jgi:predicted transcriptional regulator
MGTPIPIGANGKISFTASVLRALSDEKSLALFKIIASVPSISADYVISNGGLINTQLLISKVKLTRKQYYSRISTLISSGLVKRSNGKYLLTSLGKVVYSVNAIIDQAIQDHWKLKAIDALETKSSLGIPDEEREKIVGMLIDNYELRGILTARRFRHKKVEEQISSDVKSTSAVAKHSIPMQFSQT